MHIFSHVIHSYSFTQGLYKCKALLKISSIFFFPSFKTDGFFHSQNSYLSKRLFYDLYWYTHPGFGSHVSGNSSQCYFVTVEGVSSKLFLSFYSWFCAKVLFFFWCSDSAVFAYATNLP